jgi:hypothetical protein
VDAFTYINFPVKKAATSDNSATFEETRVMGHEFKSLRGIQRAVSFLKKEKIIILTYIKCSLKSMIS